jgi:hypothetical protein
MGRDESALVRGSHVLFKGGVPVSMRSSAYWGKSVWTSLGTIDNIDPKKNE